MITLAICAVLGAALGLYVKPRWLGVLAGAVLVATIEGSVLLLIEMISSQPNRELFIGRLQAVFGEGVVGASGAVCAAFVGGVLAAMMDRFTDRDDVLVVSADSIRRKVGKDGRFARLEGMVEDRPIHARAESRIDTILDL